MSFDPEDNRVLTLPDGQTRPLPDRHSFKERLKYDPASGKFVFRGHRDLSMDDWVPEEELDIFDEPSDDPHYGRRIDCVTRVLETNDNPRKYPNGWVSISTHAGIRSAAVHNQGQLTYEPLPRDLLATIGGYRVAAKYKFLSFIPDVLDAGVVEWDLGRGPMYVSTAWVPGSVLNERFHQVPNATREQLLYRVLGILQELHERNVAFGDLKPGNVIVDPKDEQVSLIDLDTMREVMRDTGFAKTYEYTPAYAAPELTATEPRLYRQSDVFAYGAMLLSLFGAERSEDIPAPWDEVARACRLGDPTVRPLVPQVMAFLQDPRGAPLPAGRDVGRLTDAELATGRHPRMKVEGTERVADPVIPSTTERVNDPDSEPPIIGRAENSPKPAGGGSRSQSKDTGAFLKQGLQPDPRVVTGLPPFPPFPEFTEPVAEREVTAFASRSGRWRRWIAALGVLVLAGVGWSQWQDRRTRQSVDAVAVELWADLKAHKTVAHQNNAEVLQAVIDEVHVQLARWRSPGMLGVASVATVWQQGWHLRKAKWDAAAFAASETLVAEALEAERTPQALYAHAQLNGAACRLMPSSPDRVVRCAYAQAAFEVLFESYEGRPGAEGWFIVESRWAAESLEKVDLIRALQAVEEKWVDAREDEGVQAAAALALAHCDQARAFLDDAPVNARFLAGDCVRVAGWSGDLRRYLEWVDVYVDQALAVGSKGKELNKRSAAIVFAGGLPECREAVRLTGDAQDWSVKLVDDSPAGFGDLCAYLGYRAIGCETRGNAHKHYDDLSLGPIVLKRQLKPQGLPWSEVQTALNKHGAAGTCPL